MRDCSTLNPREIKDLQKLHSLYLKAKEEKNYTLSDKLRAELISKGTSPPNYDSFHPVFESVESRVSRLASRYVYGEP